MPIASVSTAAVPRDDGEAVRWYRRAAEQGLALAQHNLAVMYRDGRGVSQDFDEALRWFRQAAEQENPNAQTGLGAMYQQGRDVRRSNEEAVRWYRRAADQGHAPGQTNLGYMYEEGRGVRRNRETAVQWYRRAAEQGFAHGQYRLGRMYERGREVWGGTARKLPAGTAWRRTKGMRTRGRGSTIFAEICKRAPDQRSLRQWPEGRPTDDTIPGATHDSHSKGQVNGRPLIGSKRCSPMNLLRSSAAPPPPSAPVNRGRHVDRRSRGPGPPSSPSSPSAPTIRSPILPKLAAATPACRRAAPTPCSNPGRGFPGPRAPRLRRLVVPCA